ncbi:MAG: cell division protein FtsL [Roseburia sp.]|nr:cell division protein FtsL [Roseburia sp.]
MDYNYIDGSTVRKAETAPVRREVRRTAPQRAHGSRPHPQGNTRRHSRRQVKAAPMNVGYIAVVAGALAVTCIVLIFYIGLQSTITGHINNISRLESELNDLKLSNDELYTKIMSSVDLEEIKRIAVNELGMKYAREGQVITYSGEGSDYVRQYSDIPE